MKINRMTLGALKFAVRHAKKKDRKKYPPHGEFKEFINVPYINDNCYYHSYDVYLAKENRKNICMLHIHGGSYIFGMHQDSYPFGYQFLKEGYDFCALDYLPNNGKRDMVDLIEDCVKNINHIFAHLKDYGLENDKFVIVGDSAGGHFALLIAELFSNKNLQDLLGLHLEGGDIKAVLLNCPVYDFAPLGRGEFTKAATIYMLGPKGLDVDYLQTLSPREYISSLKYPLFVSTCTNDFLRKEAYTLKEDLDKLNYTYQLLDIDSDNKDIDHVHNVSHPDYPESKQVNNEMMKFIDKFVK